MGEPDLHPADEAANARSRIDLLLDEDSFHELGGGAGLVAGFGTVDDRPVCLFSEYGDPSVESTGAQHAARIVEIVDLALSTGCPLVGMYDGGGAMPGQAAVIRATARASGAVPQLSLIMGRSYDGSALSPALADFVIMVDETSQLLLAEPEVITTVTGSDATAEELGGAWTHAATSGTAHHLAADEQEAVDYVSRLLSYLPQNSLDDPPSFEPPVGPEVDAVDGLVPDAPHQPYDVRDVITAVLDDADFLEVHELYAPNVVVGFGRLDGRSVGLVASQPLELAGHLDSAAAEKAARFVRICDAYNIAVVTVVDVPGFLPGVEQEMGGGIRRMATLGSAYAEATVPLVTVIIGRAYGGAHEVLGSKQLGADVVLAWPGARIAAAGPQRTVAVRHGQEIRDADDPEARRAELVLAYQEETEARRVGPGGGQLDAVIRPGQTRTTIIQALRLLRGKRQTLPPKKHGNVPR